jgi:hypothetical protein
VLHEKSDLEKEIETTIDAKTMSLREKIQELED